MSPFIQPGIDKLDDLDVAVVNRSLTEEEKRELSEFIRQSKEVAAKKKAHALRRAKT